MAKGARWSVCEDKPGRPSGGTVRVHRRPCGALSPDRATPETDGRRTAVPGGRPGPARFSLGPALDPLRPRPPRPPVPLPAPAVRLQQAPQRRRPPDQPRDRGTGPAGAHLARRPAADRLHPLPCAASRETVKRSELAGHCGYGYCRSHSRFFWGFRLYLVTTAEGMPVTWCLASPETRRTGGDGRATRTRPPPRPPRTGDPRRQGFAGKEFEAFCSERLGVHLVRPDREDEPARHGKIARVRQWIEAVIDTLKGQLSLEQHGGRTPSRSLRPHRPTTLALAAGIWHNWATNAPVKRSLIAYDH